MPRRRRRNSKYSDEETGSSDASIDEEDLENKKGWFRFITCGIYLFNFEFAMFMIFSLGMFYNSGTSADENITNQIFDYVIPGVTLILCGVGCIMALLAGFIKSLWGAIGGIIVVGLNVLSYPYWIIFAQGHECCKLPIQSSVPYAEHALAILFAIAFTMDCFMRYFRGLKKDAEKEDDY